MRLSRLLRATIRTVDGQTLGRVREVHCEKGRIVALVSGPASLIEGRAALARGRRIAWEQVRRVSGAEVLVTTSRSTRKT